MQDHEFFKILKSQITGTLKNIFAWRHLPWGLSALGHLISFPIKVLLLLFVISHISFKVCVFLHVFCLLKLLFLCCLCFKNQLMFHNIVYPSTSFQAGKLPPFLFISLIICHSLSLWVSLSLSPRTHHTTNTHRQLMNVLL